LPPSKFLQKRLQTGFQEAFTELSGSFRSGTRARGTTAGRAEKVSARVSKPQKELYMNTCLRVIALSALISVALRCGADESPECASSKVEAHVLEQFGIYGPMSKNREYFGFIFVKDGVIGSATTRGGVCRSTQPCEVGTMHAAAKIPAGAKVLGEWHTHPRASGSQDLSAADVRGANANRHISCYRAFFSTPGGDILAWNPNESDTKAAMASSIRLGSYRSKRVEVPRQADNSP
jgi:hypothetical protein